MQLTKMKWQELDSVRLGSAQSVVRARLYARNSYAFEIDVMQYTLFSTRTDRRHQHRTRGTHSQSQHNTCQFFLSSPIYQMGSQELYTPTLCASNGIVSKGNPKRVLHTSRYSRIVQQSVSIFIFFPYCKILSMGTITKSLRNAKIIANEKYL